MFSCYSAAELVIELPKTFGRSGVTNKKRAVQKRVSLTGQETGVFRSAGSTFVSILVRKD